MTMTITEFARKGNRAQRDKYSAAQFAKWGSLGGRPKGSKDKKPRKRKLDTKRKSSPRA
jgi:hypothetical protein